MACVQAPNDSALSSFAAFSFSLIEKSSLYGYLPALENLEGYRSCIPESTQDKDTNHGKKI